MIFSQLTYLPTASTQTPRPFNSLAHANREAGRRQVGVIFSIFVEKWRSCKNHENGPHVGVTLLVHLFSGLHPTLFGGLRGGGQGLVQWFVQ